MSIRITWLVMLWMLLPAWVYAHPPDLSSLDVAINQAETNGK